MFTNSLAESDAIYLLKGVLLFFILIASIQFYSRADSYTALFQTDSLPPQVVTNAPAIENIITTANATNNLAPSSSLEYIDISIDGLPSTNPANNMSIDYVHVNALPHRGAVIVIINQHDETLIVQRSNKSVTCSGSWSIIGEHTHFTESYEKTAYRGLIEEVLLDIGPDTEINHPNVDLLPYHDLYKFWGDRIKLVPHSPHPRLLRIFYGNNRTDVQWTAIFSARINTKYIKVGSLEASKVFWVPLIQLGEWSQYHDFCDAIVDIVNDTRLLFTHQGQPKITSISILEQVETKEKKRITYKDLIRMAWHESQQLLDQLDS